MASRAAELVAEIIDRIEGRPYGTGRPPLPTVEVVETLRFFVREGVHAGGYDAVVDAACAAWNALLAEPGRLRSLTSFPWLPASVTTS